MRSLRSLLPALACSIALVVALHGTATRADDASDEAQAGAELFSELKSQGEIVETSPLYDTLRPIAAGITRVVQPQYPFPIRFYIVHENQPNAFAAPGGNVYVTDSLFYFVKNTEEFAGTLCHETSHLLHRDSIKKMQEEKDIEKRALAATVLFPTIATVLAATAIGRLDANHYSRDVEEAADLKGADTCAAAGDNPWGLVWLFQDFTNANLKQPPEILSDHPNDAHRIEQLKAHFTQNPAVFSRFDSDIKKATPFNVAKNEAEHFYR